MNTSERRTLVQEKIYLLQLSGLDLGYRYVCGIKGSYSPSLSVVTLTAWKDKEALGKLINKYQLNEWGLIKNTTIPEQKLREIKND